MRMIPTSTALAVLLSISGSSAMLAAEPATIPVTIAKDGENYRLFRGDEPYEIKGAGLEYADMSVFASHGGNSIRTWRTDNAEGTGLELLDEAAANGLTVLLCIEIGRERHGFDYNDQEAVRKQFEYARGEVLKYKDHPALLGWMIGNEPNLSFKNPKVFDAINDISMMIHELDGQHPTTTALAGFSAELAEIMEERASDLDFVSVQFYGDIVNLPGLMEKIGYEKPYMVTEWGAIGHWEVPKTTWGAPVEQNSSDKAANYRKSHEIAIAGRPRQVMGSYVFLWGQKQERTPTWYGMLLEDGSKTETIDVMHRIWTGSWPSNRAPGVGTLKLDSRTAYDSVTVKPGMSYEAEISASDPDGDMLEYRWEVMRESQAKQEGGDLEAVPEVLSGLTRALNPGNAVITAPAQPGAYRLFVYVLDGHGNAGHANVPFLVE